jgi:hypothetical protein
MDRPLGDQSNRPGSPTLPTLVSPGVRTLTGRFPEASFSAGTTHRRILFGASSTTRASRFSFSACSSSSVFGSVSRKAMREPSGDQRGSATPPFSSVSASASPPSARIRQRLGRGSLPSLPALPRADTKATHLPSGDQAGAVADFSPAVSSSEPDPSLRPRWICDTHSLFSPSMTAVATTKAARRPSGETRTGPTRLTLKLSSGVQTETGASARPRGTGERTIRTARHPAIRISPSEAGQRIIGVSRNGERSAIHSRGASGGSRGVRRSAPLAHEGRGARFTPAERAGGSRGVRRSTPLAH